MDREWKPTYVVPLLSMAGNDLACTVMEFDTNSPGDFFVGSFDGELCNANFTLAEGVDNPDFTNSISRPHCGPVVCLARSPYFPDLLLSVGDSSFHLWKAGSALPLFTAGYANERYTAAVWSPTRQAVLFLGLADGSIQCWDLLDRSHEAALHVNVCSTAICTLSFNTVAATEKAQLLAVGDAEGMLRIAEVPSTLRRTGAGEHQQMTRFLDTETAKVADLEARQVRSILVMAFSTFSFGNLRYSAVAVQSVKSTTIVCYSERTTAEPNRSAW